MSHGKDQKRIRTEYQKRRKQSLGVQESYDGCVGCIGWLVLFAVFGMAPRWLSVSEELVAAGALFCWLLFSLCCERCPACNRWLPCGFVRLKSCPRCRTPLRAEAEEHEDTR
jgi:hypothetical protein